MFLIVKILVWHVKSLDKVEIENAFVDCEAKNVSKPKLLENPTRS